MADCRLAAIITTVERAQAARRQGDPRRRLAHGHPGRDQPFAEATGDHQWIHVDPERAKSGPFGGTIAHGFWTLSAAPFIMRGGEGVQVRLPSRMGINYGLNRVRFISPVPRRQAHPRSRQAGQRRRGAAERHPAGVPRSPSRSRARPSRRWWPSRSRGRTSTARPEERDRAWPAAVAQGCAGRAARGSGRRRLRAALAVLRRSARARPGGAGLLHRRSGPARAGRAQPARGPRHADDLAPDPAPWRKPATSARTRAPSATGCPGRCSSCRM